MRERRPDRADVAAGKLAQSTHRDRHQELSALPAQRPRQTDETDLDDEALRSCSQFHADSLVGYPAVARHKRQGFAEVFRGRDDIEEDPRITRIDLLGQVKTESRILDRFRGAIKEPALSSGRYAMMEGTALRQVALRDAGGAQHRGGGDVTPPQGVDCVLGRKPHRCRQALPAGVLGHVNAPAAKAWPDLSGDWPAIASRPAFGLSSSMFTTIRSGGQLNAARGQRKDNGQISGGSD